MNFVMSYSCGKDSTLALNRLMDEGHHPVGLLVMVNEAQQRSWFHGADSCLLNKISKSLTIPLILCPSKGEEYHLALEDGLSRAIQMGAEFAGFGDIDIEEHRQWCRDRCEKVGLQARFPLWRESRETITREMIERGYQCIIKAINNELLPTSLLGKRLSAETVDIMKRSGIDVCGENGEYHTIVVNGPIFKTPVTYETGKILRFENSSIIEIG